MNHCAEPLPSPDKSRFPSPEEIRALHLVDLGPSERDRAIWRALVCEGRSEDDLAFEFGLAPRTLRNIARATTKWLARREWELGRMTTLEMLDEETRLRRLQRGAEDAWEASREPLVTTRVVESLRGTRTTTTTRPREGDPRFVAVVLRLLPEMVSLEARLDRLLRESEVSMAEETEESAVRTVARRTRRRKSMGGKRLRLPRFVRTARRTRLSGGPRAAIFTLLTIRARCWGAPFPLAGGFP